MLHLHKLPAGASKGWWSQAAIAHGEGGVLATIEKATTIGTVTQNQSVVTTYRIQYLPKGGWRGETTWEFYCRLNWTYLKASK